MGYVTINCFPSLRTTNTILEWIQAAVSRNPTKRYSQILTTHHCITYRNECHLCFYWQSFQIFNGAKIEKMFVEADQAIYNKLLDAIFKMSEDGHDMFSKMIPRMGGFHIIMCILKTIFSRFKDSAIIKLFVYSEIRSERTCL